MELRIKYESKDDIDKFSNWLTEKIFTYTLDTIDIDRLNRFDKVVQQTVVDQLTNKPTTYTAYSILIAAMTFLVVKHKTNCNVIEIDDAQVIPNTNAKFIDVVKLINYGNLNASAYNIVDRVFNHFADNVNEYYNKFLEES